MQITELEEVKSFSADFIGLQETKLNETHKETIYKTTKTIQKMLESSVAFKSNSDSFSELCWKPGGLATLTMKELRRKENKLWTDPTALIQRTRVISTDRKLSIINIYLPKFNPGATSSYTQALNTIRQMKGWKGGDSI